MPRRADFRKASDGELARWALAVASRPVEARVVSLFPARSARRSAGMKTILAGPRDSRIDTPCQFVPDQGIQLFVHILCAEIRVVLESPKPIAEALLESLVVLQVVASREGGDLIKIPHQIAEDGHWSEVRRSGVTHRYEANFVPGLSKQSTALARDVIRAVGRDGQGRAGCNIWYVDCVFLFEWSEVVDAERIVEVRGDERIKVCTFPNGSFVGPAAKPKADTP